MTKIARAYEVFCTVVFWVLVPAFVIGIVAPIGVAFWWWVFGR